MLEPMTVRLDLWPLAADDIAIHVLDDNRDAWRGDPIPADTTVQAEVDFMLWQHGYRLDPAGPIRTVLLTHQTSSHQDGPHLWLTWVAIIAVPPGEYARDLSATARPVGQPLAQVLPKPAPHAPTETPATLRDSDHLLHMLRDLGRLAVSDADLAPAFDDRWRRHLAELSPILDTLYQR
jgi:hypothetical protein